MSDVDPVAVNEFNRGVIDEFRTNEGQVGGLFQGAPMLLLTSTGAKTGRRHTTPVVYTTDGDRLVILASKGGSPTNPAWYHNLVANPEATVELGPDTFKVKAVVTTGEERSRLFEQQAAVMPNFAEYQQKTTRQIPVIALERIN